VVNRASLISRLAAFCLLVYDIVSEVIGFVVCACPLCRPRAGVSLNESEETEICTMGDADRANPVDANSEGGIAGAHPELESVPAYVSPATAQQRNVIVSPLVPIACWRVDDIRFDFDSSFVLPETADEISALADLRAKHTLKVPGKTPRDAGSSVPPPLSLFGHADPVGTDDYNKQLSGRRVTAVYALLTRKPALWENLYSQSLGGDKWGSRALSIMLTTADPSLNDDSTTLQQKISAAQSSSGTRSGLYSSYMNKVCGSFQLDPADFLGQGKDSGGKADYQGCSEFNPVLLFSQQEEQEFADPDNKQKRDAANAPNRRVMGLLFRPGSTVDPNKWPCPRATEGIAGCVNRFWSNGEARRSTLLDGQRRRFERSHDTFACRFYQRLAYNSPCERVENLIQIQFLYEDKTPMADAEYRAVFDEVSLTGKTDKNGKATIAPPEDAPDEFTIFLTSVPEKYSGLPEETAGSSPDASQPDSSGAVASDDDGGPSSVWPNNVLVSILLAVMLCGWARPAMGQSAELPPVAAVLKGPLYRNGGIGSIELTLTVDPDHPSGRVTYSGAGEFTMMNAKLELVEVWGGPLDRKARYRLQYQTDRCEHAAALSADAQPASWDPCFYVQGGRRPRVLHQAEAMLLRERMPDHEVMVAVGSGDVRALTETFRAVGSVAR